MTNNYNLELEKAAESIEKLDSNSPKVLIQLPDGLKPKAKEIVDFLKQKKPNAKINIWLGSCFGACDIPNVKEEDFDLIIQWGHSSWE